MQYILISGICRKISKEIHNNLSTYYIIMEFCFGESLSTRIHDIEQKITKEETFGWLTQIADGMQYLHSKKIIHRDLKPSK